MATKNDVTGDLIMSRLNTKHFNEKFDRIFGVKKESVEENIPDEKKVKEVNDGSED